MTSVTRKRRRRLKRHILHCMRGSPKTICHRLFLRAMPGRCKAATICSLVNRFFMLSPCSGRAVMTQSELSCKLASFWGVGHKLQPYAGQDQTVASCFKEFK